MFTRSVSEARCGNWRHRAAIVHAFGTRTSGGVKYQRYRCTPRTGRAHLFQVAIDLEEGAKPVPWSPPPRCPKHPAGHVIRYGLYAKHSEHPRQRYLCKPDEGKPHVFVPTLPRAYVDHGFADTCEFCERTLGKHDGQRAVARRHSWSSLTVAKGLLRAAKGETYGDGAKWALSRVKGLPRTRRRAGTPSRTKRARTAEANNRWHIVADWVDVYGPVLWAPLEREMREAAVRERRLLDAEIALGVLPDRPLIWIADELSIHGTSDELFSVLVVGECVWEDGQEQPHLQLRVARAMPDRSTAAWLLVLHELAGEQGGPDEVWPDFLVSDGSMSLLKAVSRRFGDRTQWVPSLWHLAKSLREVVTGSTGTNRPTNYVALETLLGRLNRDSGVLASETAWTDWWNTLDALLRSMGLTNKSSRRLDTGPLSTRRPVWESAVTAVLPALARVPIPISNGGLEELQKSWIDPLFVKRTTFTSIERTNRLTDLAVAASRGKLDDDAAVAKQLRQDAHNHGGRAIEPRALADPADPETANRYRSLRDRSFTSRRARELGLL